MFTLKTALFGSNGLDETYILNKGLMPLLNSLIKVFNVELTFLLKYLLSKIGQPPSSSFMNPRTFDSPYISIISKQKNFNFSDFKITYKINFLILERATFVNTGFV